MKMKEYKDIIESKQREKKKKNEDFPLTFLMLGAKLKWMLQLQCIFIRWSNKYSFVLLYISPTSFANKPSSFLDPFSIRIVQLVPYCNSFLMYLKQATSI